MATRLAMEQRYNHMDKSILFIFSGLPGTGKSTLAKATGATYLRIDPAEQAIRDLCDYEL